MSDLRGTYIVILNWNGWRDTIACLESLLPDLQRGARVVVCDNASGDGSVDHILAWSRGDLDAGTSANPRLLSLQQSKLPRPEALCIDRARAEQGPAIADTPLVIIENGANLGFAAGNNVGLRLALRQPDMCHVWLLNNDTLVEPDCLSRMHERLAGHERPSVCGSVIHFFDAPDTIQCIGGNRFDQRRGRALQSEGRYLPEDRLPAMGSVEQSLDYLSGCSMLLTRRFLEEVGLMCEDYFLYYEEIDWFTRAGGRFDLLVAGGARLYHREGASIGSRSLRRAPSLTSDRYMFSSRIAFMRRYFPQHLLRCAVANWLDVGKRLLRGQWRNALLIGRILLSGAQAR